MQPKSTSWYSQSARRRTVTLAIAMLISTLLNIGLTVAPLAQNEAAPPTGALLIVRGGELERLDLATNAQRALARVPGAIITRVAHSGDRQRIAYTATYYDQNFALGRSEIIIADADGANATTVLAETESRFSVSGVAWTHDPTRLVYVKTNSSRTIERVEELDLTTGARSLILDGGLAPSASPTEPALTYQTRMGNQYDIRRLDRRAGERTILVPPNRFEDVDRPTYSPDGASIAFVAVDESPPTDDGLLLRRFFDLGRPQTAAAHDVLGALFELWVMSANGDNLRRIAPLFDSNPEIAWSPDSRQIAALGGFQLQTVDIATGVTRPVDRPTGTSSLGGSLSWGLR